jgi:succinate dehydrogenase cytochrome b subunit
MTTRSTAVRRRTTASPRSASRPWPSTFLCKQVMAVTGLVFGLFVLVHMIGNLKAYLGPQHFDDYALWLRRLLEPLFPYAGVLWTLRVVLLICLLAHVACAVILVGRARGARGPFRRTKLAFGAFGARSMLVTGVVLLLFVIFHLLDLTTGSRPVASPSFVETTGARSFAYENLVHSFDRPWAAAVYMLAMALLGLHLAHGLWLAVNDLGATGRRTRQVGMITAGAVALAVTVGNLSLPIAVLTGVVS